MRFVIEVVADSRDDAANLLREAAHKIKRSKETSGHEVNHCIGDYRVFVGEDLYDTMTASPEQHLLCEKNCGRHAPAGKTICISCSIPLPGGPTE